MRMGDISHSVVQIGRRTAITKNGIQHTMNAPVIIANVFAAFLSRFDPESFELCVFRFKIEGFSLFFCLLFGALWRTLSLEFS